MHIAVEWRAGELIPLLPPKKRERDLLSEVVVDISYIQLIDDNA